MYFYVRFVGDREFRCEVYGDDYEMAMSYVNAFCLVFEYFTDRKYVAYVSPVPFDD